jgi:Beta-1,3-glucanase
MNTLFPEALSVSIAAVALALAVPAPSATTNSRQSISLNWPTPDVVMKPGTQVGIWGTESATEKAEVLVAIQNNHTGWWLVANGTWGEETWFNAPIVDATGTWRWMYTPMSTGSFTVFARLTEGGATDQTSSTFNVGGADPNPPQPPPDPTQGFPLRVVNGTAGRWADSEVWITIIGQQTKDNWSYLTPDGSVHHIDHTQADAPDHLTHNGVNYAPLSVQLPISGSISMPSNFQGARVYISLGSPLYLSIFDDTGIALPDVNNPSDPNADTYWDFYEYTYVNGEVAYGGNTSQVDQFGFPINVRVEQDWTGFDRSTTYMASRDAIRGHFLSGADPGYANLVNDYHVLTPRTSVAFRKSSASEAMRSYIDAVWQQYANNEFKLTRLDQTFMGRVEPDGGLRFAFQKTDSYVLRKPTAEDVWQCSGALASGNDVEKALGAEFCAAFNRGVADNTTLWWDGSQFLSRTGKE